MNSYTSVFGVPPEVVSKCSGRVNLIGEHTDYNGGFVLPASIPQQTQVELSPRADAQVRIHSCNFTGSASMGEYHLGGGKKSGTWLDYIQGVTYILRTNNFNIRGFDLHIASDVPMGGGLSSSAALEVSLFRGLRQAFGLAIDDIQIAMLSQKVENDFVGARVGIMDPMACSLAEPGSALFLDTRSLEFHKIPLPEKMQLIVIHSGVSHRNVGGAYNTRRSECEMVCEKLGIKELRDFDSADLKKLETLPETLKRRARHVICENERVLAAVHAINKNDLFELGHLFKQSHISMRDDYEVSVPEIDLLVDLACKQDSVYGARMTGGGFGGSIIALTHGGKGRETAEHIVSLYRALTGLQAQILVPTC